MQCFWQIVKRLVVAFGAVVLLVQVHRMPVMADETQVEKVEAIAGLADEITYFYLDPRAADFMNNFYTRESYEHLRAAFNQAQELMVSNWETELDAMALTELYQLLRFAVTNLRPLTMRRGEAIARNQNLNFRVQPETGTQVFHTLTYGTPFEILEEVQGGVVIGDDLSRSYRWFRIRHSDQSGYVHARYVRDLPVSEERIRLLADIGRQELWISSKIDGWQTDFSPDTRAELQDVLSSARGLQIGNWQFDLNYDELNQILERLSYEHLNLVTLFRYNLITGIIELKREIKNNVQGTGSARMENYTEASWESMDAALVEAQALLSEDWQNNLSDEALEFVHEVLFLGIQNLEPILQQPYLSEEIEAVNLDFNPERIVIIGAIALAGIIGIVLIIIIKIIKYFYYR